MDFGLAQMTKQKKSGPTEYAVGTPGYMPPEQVRGEDVDHRGDLYSVGAILYQLLTGRLPFPGTTVMEILMAQAEGGPPIFASIGLGDSIPPAVEEVVRIALQINPDDRFQSAAELFEAYEAAVLRGYEAGPESDLEGPGDLEPEPPPPLDEEGDEALSGKEDATVERVEAYMSEQLAAVKLQTFIEEVGGKIIEESPGLMRVHLKMNPQVLRSTSRGGVFSWLGFGPKYALVEMELHIKKKDPKDKRGILQITARVYPTKGGPVPDNPEWIARCNIIFQALRSCLMST
jgi:serine/threonine-protein kinase